MTAAATPIGGPIARPGTAPGGLAALAARLADSPGLAGKRDILDVVRGLGLGANASGTDASDIRVGDDTAALPAPGGGWNLFACEAMLPAFVAAMPRFAGFSAVWVNVSDVLAMGGRPTAIVDALWAPDAASAAPVVEGMRAAAELVGVPIVGGHANLRAPALSLSAAVLGRAEALLTSFDAEPGDALVAAIDLRGRSHAPWPFWDAASEAPAARVRADLELLPALAESGLARAAKDISQGGLVGTAAMLAECSGVGIEIDVDAVPRPDAIESEPWLCTFPSFGFLIAAKPADVDAVCARFAARDIDADAIGRIDASGELALRRGDARAVVRDLGADPLIGCGPRAAGPGDR